MKRFLFLILLLGITACQPRHLPPIVQQQVRNTQRVYIAMDVSVRGDATIPIEDLYMFIHQRVRSGPEPFKVTTLVRQFPGDCVPDYQSQP